ncbi:MAG: osmotically inducible protein C [Ignavibacteriae bacterium HGW-Ignavibacteriae-4]|jgi:putative redox protein|nr:MAG: osmotically inducible protein C [Ignavibacteriae bacterium HGW-Ignavibacteriae-4]
MKSERLLFKNSDGLELSARLELPIDRKPVSYAIFAHCFTCNKNLTAVTNITRELTNSGFAVLRFDFTGLGESEGDFSETNFSSNINDLVCAADYLATNYGEPTLIVGHSLGGAASIFAAAVINSIKAVATIGAPSSPDHVKHLFEEDITKIETQGSAKILLAGRPFEVKKQFLDDISSKNMKATLANLNKAILIMHSPQDATVGISNAAEIYTNAKHPKSFVTLDGADHMLMNSRDSKYAGQVISGWVSRYVDTEEVKKLRPKKTVLARIGSTGFTTDIQSGNHSITADEPLSVGGDDFGPNPYDLLMASLGACTAMTMRMYADRKGWAIDEIIVHLSHEKQHVKDCQDCDTTSGYIDKIEKEIEIIADLDSEQRQRLLEIADKCPIHRTLHNEVKVYTKLI